MNKRPAEEENVCSFFLARKKRPCRMKTQEGMSFCPHHSHLGSEQDPVKGVRIPCPYDSSHFCYQSKLQKHLKKCNAREKDKPEFYVENINLEDNDCDNTKVSLSDVSDEELLAFIQRIQNLYNEFTLTISEATSLHPVLQSEMEKSDDGFNTFKHLKQQAALLDVMEKKNFLKEGSCFIEFGAGRGQLMYWIVKCVPESQKPVFILVDRSAQRHKSDNKFKGTELQIKRIRIDIQHLHLGRIQSIKDKLNKTVGVCKHLCGGATDLAMKCMMNTLVYEKEDIEVKEKSYGLLMALCCHHRCSWNSYVGKQFMKKCGISVKEFKLMCCMASWATCGLRKFSSDKEVTKNDDIHTTDIQDDNNFNRYKKLNLKHEEREVIGMQCKRIIDAGRVDYLESEGYDVELLTYTDKSVSLENIAMLATYKKS